MLWKLRGEALSALRQLAEAEQAVQAAQKFAPVQGARPLLWQIHLALGNLYQADKRQVEADHEFTAARQSIEALANDIPDIPASGLKADELRRNFLRQAIVMIPLYAQPPDPAYLAAQQSFAAAHPWFGV